MPRNIVAMAKHQPTTNNRGIPRETLSLALVVDDPDSSGGTFDHWVVWNVSPTTTKIGEHSVHELRIKRHEKNRVHRSVPSFWNT
jgi:phosphatidylethanolamine-binding protein (PEBP) family uncharacterized protein